MNTSSHIQTKAGITEIFGFIYDRMVPGAGLEPARYCNRGILSPLRLPISPPGLGLMCGR
jgi:hypothetical protein